jgi:hypothetical protein
LLLFEQTCCEKSELMFRVRCTIIVRRIESQKIFWDDEDREIGGRP